EHNLDVIKTADWIVDMGPEGGSGGGIVVAEGTPEDVAGIASSHTGQFLRPVLGVSARSGAASRRATGTKRAARTVTAAARKAPAKRTTRATRT
ncbi:MAG: hypothetical protein ACRDVG_12945, partial [Jatrophihabitantaceae bacterium]